MKTIKKIMYLIFASSVIFGNGGCNGDVFKSLIDPKDENLILLTGAQLASPTSGVSVPSITSTTPNGAYGFNTEVNITVKFTGQVTLAGELMGTLETGRRGN